MFGADAHADQARWNSAQDREAHQHPNEERRLECAAALEHARDDVILDRDLETLCYARRQFPASLNVSEMLIVKLSSSFVIEPPRITFR